MEKKLTREAAIERNGKIMQLRGILPRLTQLIPEDVAKKFGDEKMRTLLEYQYELLNILDEVKVKKYVCKNCADVSKLKETHSKRAIACDFCRDWYEQLYLWKEIPNV